MTNALLVEPRLTIDIGHCELELVYRLAGVFERMASISGAVGPSRRRSSTSAKASRKSRAPWLRNSRPITLEIRELRERTVDLILGRGVFPIPENDLDAEILFEEPLIVRRRSPEPLGAAPQARVGGACWREAGSLSAARGPACATSLPRAGFGAPAGERGDPVFHRRDMLLMTGDYLTVIPASMLPRVQRQAADGEAAAH
jgi:hypothetical protein